MGEMAGGKDKKKPPDRGEVVGKTTRGGQGDSSCGSGREIAVQVSPADLPRARRRCSTKKIVFLSILVALFAIGIAVYLQQAAHKKILEEIMIMNLGPEAYSTFSSYDRDGDGYLSLAEFEPLVAKLGGEENLVRKVCYARRRHSGITTVKQQNFASILISLGPLIR